MIAIETRTEIMPDLGIQPKCEIVWEPPEGEGAPYQCGRPATWQAMAHDEVHRHDNNRLLLCGQCVTIAKAKRKCHECEVPLIYDLRRL